ncbi:hypothetical protein G7Y89_g15386 [Cudoniella acicularis]|uniref:Alpha-ketoglutarate-dependent dioxygenase AlkB-like domain-containing protein n=1 Tax=Cudoniella acicularis TaxID=354080 RepID=A0A8H4QPD9_9HELO|nr:hypothetical protein G7Y89_g15386 [Cudoniella acicularis]
MDPKEPLDAPSTRHDLDPYQQAPQVLKDIYKSWTGAIPRNCKEGYLDTASLSMPGVDSIPGWVVQPEFVRFVQGIALSPGFHRGDPDPNPRQTRIATGVEKRSLYWLDFGPDGPGYSELEKYSIASPWRQNKAENDLLDFLSTAKYGAFSFKNIPGLTIIPGLFPPIVQQTLLECLFHRELSRPENKTNLHLHYNISYPQQHDTFFSTTGASTSFTPKNLNENKALSNATVLEKSLRWITLGGQYDWTKKEYPKETPPEFPDDIARLVGSIFTDMKPEAAIVNLYSAKDKLSLHRDVSEEADRGLESFIIKLFDLILETSFIWLRNLDLLGMESHKFSQTLVQNIFEIGRGPHIQSGEGG